MFLTKKQNESEIKIIDFGLSKVYNHSKVLKKMPTMVQF
jgi:hypothetical protein